MPSTTKQFAWKDRDTAGYDLLQLVYHAPLSISYYALRLLTVIKSPKIIPDLLAIVLDESQYRSRRVDALRAIARTSGNIFMPELADIAALSLNRNTEFIRSRFLGEVIMLVGKHPVNGIWFLDVLENNVKIQRKVLERLLSVTASTDLQRLTMGKLLKLLDDSPQTLSLSNVSNLTRHLQYSQIWLDDHFDEIVALCIADVGSLEFISVVKQWSEMADVLREQLDNFDEILANPPVRVNRRKHDTEPPKYLESSAYQYLYRKYLDATNGNEQALNHLTQACRITVTNIPFRAVAVHFIGKLYQQFDVADTLYYQSGDVNDDWGSDVYMPGSPVRIEAGEALMNLPNAETWERLVNAFFIVPRDGLLHYQLKWIEYITDILSGDILEVSDNDSEPRNRAWFKALADISEAELQELTQNIR
jgi:hypothetical protein